MIFGSFEYDHTHNLYTIFSKKQSFFHMSDANTFTHLIEQNFILQFKKVNK